MGLFNFIADKILDSADCKKEIIWLLKKCFKDSSELSECYDDWSSNYKKEDE